MTTITLPQLPEPDFALDQGDEPCYYAHTLRARDLEVARIVLEAAARIAEKYFHSTTAKRIREMEFDT
jgi:hypothetical protein